MLTCFRHDSIPTIRRYECDSLMGCFAADCCMVGFRHDNMLCEVFQASKSAGLSSEAVCFLLLTYFRIVLCSYFGNGQWGLTLSRTRTSFLVHFVKCSGLCSVTLVEHNWTSRGCTAWAEENLSCILVIAPISIGLTNFYLHIVGLHVDYNPDCCSSHAFPQYKCIKRGSNHCQIYMYSRSTGGVLSMLQGEL